MKRLDKSPLDDLSALKRAMAAEQSAAAAPTTPRADSHAQSDAEKQFSKSAARAALLQRPGSVPNLRSSHESDDENSQHQRTRRQSDTRLLSHSQSPRREASKMSRPSSFKDLTTLLAAEEGNAEEAGGAAAGAYVKLPAQPLQVADDKTLRDLRKQVARALMEKKATMSSDDLNVFAIQASEAESEKPRPRRRSFLQLAKRLFFKNREARGAEASSVDYTYVCQMSRMLHHSHGKDASIIDMF